MVNALLLLLGCLLEANAILLVIVPIFLPTAVALGVDPVHFGVIVVVNTMIGLATPPYGLLLFVVSGDHPDADPARRSATCCRSSPS